MDRQPKFKHGDIVKHIETGKRTIIKKPIIETVNIHRDGKLARKDIFTGEYECFWHDNNNETIYGTLGEETLQLFAS